MSVAEALCVERGQRLTPIRRKVLAALLGSHKPLGAYEIIDRLAPRGPRPAPITAYPALEFLRENEGRQVAVLGMPLQIPGDRPKTAKDRQLATPPETNSIAIVNIRPLCAI